LFWALEHEHRVAMLLQRSLLPRRLVDVVGISVAARYLPASDEVGGDWYDVFELSGGRIGIAIGDVVGHGIRAATLMGQLRTALHAYAMQGHGPARTLELVDRYVQAMPDYAMATAIYAVLDCDTGELCMASAGHLPPVVIGPRSRILEVSPSPPLGAIPYSRCREQATVLETGETLLLYTDGLVERRGIPLTESMDALLDVVRTAASAEDACRLALEHMVPPEGLRDDAALLAVENRQVPVELRLRLAAEPAALADLRRTVRRWLRHRTSAAESDVTEITMAVDEACANAIEHAYSPGPAEVELRAALTGDQVVFTVIDSGRWRTPRGEDRGRGLTIMDAAMDSVDVRATASGTTVVMRRAARR
jgi:anti-sigma regulatory factor (Ser/Thr protein kinase)